MSEANITYLKDVNGNIISPVTSVDGIVDSDGGGLLNYIISLVYPVGSIYISVNDTNPQTYMTGTTWIAWGSGKVPVGVDATDSNFETVEQEGGEETHTLSTSEMPSHTHTFSGTSASHTHTFSGSSGTTSSSGSHSHTFSGTSSTHYHGAGGEFTGYQMYNSGASRNRVASGSDYYAISASSSSYIGYNGITDTTTITPSGSISTASTHTHTLTPSGSNSSTSVTPAGTNSSTGSGSAHNNLQPYITCFMWKRTA